MENPEKKSLGCIGTLGLVSMILLGACVITDLTLSRIFKGSPFAVRFMFPFSFVERDLGGERRYEERNLQHSMNLLGSFFEEFQRKNEAALARRDLAYKPFMVIPEEAYRTKESRYSGGSDQTEYMESVSRRVEFPGDDRALTIRFPYVDWNAIPLVPVKSKRDLGRLFPNLADGIRAIGNRIRQSDANEAVLEEFPTISVPEGELIAISLAYALDAFGAAEVRRHNQHVATMIVFPLLILAFAGVYFLWREPLSVLPIRLFAAVYPIALFMEIAQPMCYSPARGRLSPGNMPELQNECRRVIAELAKDGTLDPGNKALLEAALSDPKSMFKQ